MKLDENEVEEEALDKSSGVIRGDEFKKVGAEMGADEEKKGGGEEREEGEGKEKDEKDGEASAGGKS